MITEVELYEKRCSYAECFGIWPHIIFYNVSDSSLCVFFWRTSAYQILKLFFFLHKENI